MKKHLSLIIALICFLFFTSTIISEAAVNKKINADVLTKRIPTGTLIKLRLIDPINSANAKEGDLFNSVIVEDIIVDKTIVVPAGTLVRGTFQEIQNAQMLSKGASLRLYFDHIVSPSGKQIPIAVGLCNNEYITIDGALSTKQNYGTAIKQNINTTKDIVVKPTTWSWDKGDSVLNGYPKYVMAPVTAVVAAPVAGIYFIADAIVDAFKKGDELSISQGEALYIQLIKPVDVPVH